MYFTYTPWKELALDCSRNWIKIPSNLHKNVTINWVKVYQWNFYILVYYWKRFPELKTLWPVFSADSCYIIPRLFEKIINFQNYNYFHENVLLIIYLFLFSPIKFMLNKIPFAWYYITVNFYSSSLSL